MNNTFSSIAIEEKWTSQSRADRDWKEEVSKEARMYLSDIFIEGPTVDARNRELKGCDGEGYSFSYTSEELRKLSSACSEAAEWLDRRAEEEENNE